MRSPYENGRLRRSLVMDYLYDYLPGCSEPDETGPSDLAGYRAYLVRNGGRPMARALIRARQRYTAALPVRARLSTIHRAYRRRR